MSEINEKEDAISLTLPQHKCKSCGHDYKGNFCSKCGQRHIENRFTLKQSAFWIFDQIFNLERGIVYTTKELTLRPGKVIHEYLSLATVRYMHPFRYVFVLATLSALLTIISIEHSDTTEVFNTFDTVGQGEEVDQKKLEFIEKWVAGLKKYLAFVIMLSIPFNALSSLLIYKKMKLNFTEHLILNAYGYGLTLAISSPFYLLILLPNGLYFNGIISSIVYFGFLGWIFSRVFKESVLEGILKVILITILAVIFATIAVIIIGIPIAFLYAKMLKG